jgi:hypothetical protein
MFFDTFHRLSRPLSPLQNSNPVTNEFLYCSSIQTESDGSVDNPISSNPENKGPDTSPSSTIKRQDTPSPSANQHEYSASRIAAFLNDKVDSQSMHQHSSIEASIRDHVSRMGTYIDDIDVTLAGSDG